MKLIKINEEYFVVSNKYAEHGEYVIDAHYIKLIKYDENKSYWLENRFQVLASTIENEDLPLLDKEFINNNKFFDGKLSIDEIIQFIDTKVSLNWFKGHTDKTDKKQLLNEYINETLHKKEIDINDEIYYSLLMKNDNKSTENIKQELNNIKYSLSEFFKYAMNPEKCGYRHFYDDIFKKKYTSHPDDIVYVERLYENFSNNVVLTEEEKYIKNLITKLYSFLDLGKEKHEEAKIVFNELKKLINHSDIDFIRLNSELDWDIYKYSDEFDFDKDVFDFIKWQQDSEYKYHSDDRWYINGDICGKTFYTNKEIYKIYKNRESENDI